MQNKWAASSLQNIDDHVTDQPFGIWSISDQTAQRKKSIIYLNAVLSPGLITYTEKVIISILMC